MTAIEEAKAEADGFDRRKLFKHGLLWGGLAAAAATPGSALAVDGPRDGRLSAARRRRRALALDVACLGHTLRLAPAPVGNPVETALGSGLLYGTSFLVEGNLYPAGTIQGEEFDPEGAPASGHWFCRGWIMGRSDREEPGVLTTQEYLLERITDASPYPRSQLASSGIEPGPVGASVPRSLIGGTGEFAGSRGEVIQRVTGTNTTSLPDGSPGPNFQFRFRFA